MSFFASLTAAVVAGLALCRLRSRPRPAAAANAPYQDLSLDFEARAKDLVGRLTLDEKIAQLMNDAPAIPRLGVPAYNWWNEALHGVARAGTATVFPQAIGMAASFDTALMTRVATAIGDEGRAKHHEFVRRGERGIYHGLTFWSPNINIFRDPRWGRGQETYGEDPFLTARMGVAFVKALQGDDPKYWKTVATAKHYVVHSGPEADRHTFDVSPSERDLLRDLPAGVPGAGAGGEGRVGDGRLQPRQRRVGVGEPAVPGPDPAQGLGLRRLRRVRLRRRSTTSSSATRS